MFSSTNQTIGERGLSRPFVVGLVLLLLFLSTSQDWNSNPQNIKGNFINPDKLGEEVRDTLLRNLTVENDKLERQLALIQTETLHLRRAFRAEQRGLNGTAVLEAAGVSLNEDPGESNMTLFEEGTIPTLGNAENAINH